MVKSLRDQSFTTATEDVTKTYAYKTAHALNADYSMVSFSGHGLLSGYTGNGKINKQQLVSTYYNKIGSSAGLFNNAVSVDSISWDFTQFQPELIVINLGTNDYSYCKSDVKKQAQFEKSYVAFLKKVRAKNPKAKILCTLGMMGSNLYPNIENAVKSYSKTMKDKKVYTLKLDVQLMSDGIGADWHPSEKTHSKASEKVTAYIKKIMKW